MDLGLIKKQIDGGSISSARDLEHALMLMYTNAIMFNPTGEFVHSAACDMRGERSAFYLSACYLSAF